MRLAAGCEDERFAGAAHVARLARGAVGLGAVDARVARGALARVAGVEAVGLVLELTALGLDVARTDRATLAVVATSRVFQRDLTHRARRARIAVRREGQTTGARFVGRHAGLALLVAV